MNHQSASNDRPGDLTVTPPRIRDHRPMRLLPLCGLALVVGIVTGFGAVVFRALIGFVHNLMFLGTISFDYDTSLFTDLAPWGAAIIAVPVIGSLGVTFIVNTFAPEAKGHGVPEVMYAIYYKGGIIRPVVAVAKSLASAIAIGSGAAVGREGPIIQIGSALGSTFGQVLPMAMGQRVILVAAGAGAGIAATFNTPIGGVLFATELMMPEISVNTFLPVAVATGTATFIGRMFFGSNPAFDVPLNLAPLPPEAKSAAILVLYVVLGLLMGLAAALFVRSLHWAEDLFEKLPGNYLRHAFGMLLVGVLMYVLFVTAGHYYVEGVGYATIQATLAGQLSIGWFLLVLYVCKLFATSVSLGSGSSGGIFSPSLFMGATLGGAFGEFISLLFPALPISMPAFAMVGMGSMVGSATGAAMTSVAMVFEMTRDYDIVLPMVLAVAVGLGVRRMLSRENIYTMKLARRGYSIPKALHANLFLVRSAREVMDRDFVVMDTTTPFSQLTQRFGEHRDTGHVVVRQGDRIVGVVHVDRTLREAVGAQGNVPMNVLAQRNYTIVRANAVVFDVIARLWRRGATMELVVEGRGRPRIGQVIGVITKDHIADEVAQSVRIYTR